MLDELCAAGELVWIGAGALGDDDGRVRLFFRDRVRLLATPAGGRRRARRRDPRRDPRPPRCARARASGPTCSRRRAIADEQSCSTALWDLVWAGEVTNDTFGPLRVPRRAARAEPSAAGAAAPGPARPGSVRPRARAAGRWSCRCSSRSRPPTERGARGRAAAARTPRRGHPRGRARRGCARAASRACTRCCARWRSRAGSGGAGSSPRSAPRSSRSPGAVERLRADRTIDAESRARVLVLAATDPAQPYGAALSWPERSTRRRRGRRVGRRLRGARRRRVRGLPRARRQGARHLRPETATRRRRRARPWVEALVAAHKQGRLRASRSSASTTARRGTSPLAPRCARRASSTATRASRSGSLSRYRSRYNCSRRRSTWVFSTR